MAQLRPPVPSDAPASTLAAKARCDNSSARWATISPAGPVGPGNSRRTRHFAKPAFSPSVTALIAGEPMRPSDRSPGAIMAGFARNLSRLARKFAGVLVGRRLLLTKAGESSAPTQTIASPPYRALRGAIHRRDVDDLGTVRRHPRVWRRPRGRRCRRKPASAIASARTDPAAERS